MGHEPRQTVEGASAIRLRAHQFARLATPGQPPLTLEISGALPSGSFGLQVVVLLGTSGVGVARIKHGAIRHLTSTTPAAEYEVELVATLPHFGGARWWWRCPVTGARAALLYLPDGAARWASRPAHGLAYASQRGTHATKELFRWGWRNGVVERPTRWLELAIKL